jgi:HAD superfamily hydrolase (TIGR01509 family)
VEAALIDLYDTLVWTEWALLRKRLAEAVDVTGRALMRGFVETRDARGVGVFGSAEGDLAAVFRAAGADISDERVRELARIELDTLTGGGIHLYDDALPVLRELRARGVATAIVSNCDHNTKPVVETLRLEDEVDAVVLSFEVGALKPDPAIYRIALERVGAEAGTTVFVDDQTSYLDGAAALGIRTLQMVRPNEAYVPETAGHEVVNDLWPLVRAGTNPLVQ